MLESERICQRAINNNTRETLTLNLYRLYYRHYKSRIKNRFQIIDDGSSDLRNNIINRYYACIARTARNLRGVRFIPL